MSLSRSHRLTWTMRRASWGGGGPSAIRSGVVTDRADGAVPAFEVDRGPSGSVPVTSPTVARIAVTVR